MKPYLILLSSLLLCFSPSLIAQENIEYGKGTISLKADDGKEAAFIGKLSGGGGGLFLQNALGKDAIILRSDQETKEGNASFSNQKGEERVFVGSVNNAGILGLFNEKGEEAVFLGSGEKGSAFLSIHRGEKIKAFLGEASNSPSGKMVLYHPNGQAGVVLGAPGLAGYFRLLYDDGTGAFEVAMDNNQPVVHIKGQQAHDYAEVFELARREQIEPGMVVAMAADGSGLTPSNGAYDPKAVGVISGAGAYQHGLNLGLRKDGSSDLPVAMSGQVFVKVNISGGNIKVGDLLVASDIPGEAMKAKNNRKSLGAVIGKALENFDGQDSDGLVLMLVMVR